MAHSPASEVVLDEATVRALLHRSAPDLADLPLRRAAAGWDNELWRLGADLAVRMPRREAAARLIAHEQQALPAIARALAAAGVRVPEPVLVGAPDGSYPWNWSIVPWLPGIPAIETPRAERTAWAAQLARALRHLHRPAPADAPPNPVRGVPLAQRDRAIRARLDGIGPVRVVECLRAAWDAGLAAPAATERVWTHGDLHPGNLLVADGRLRAMIDFGDVTAGDPAYDIAGMWLAFDADGRHAFRTETGDRYDAATWTRARGWAAALAAILLHASDDLPTFRALGASTAAELMADR
ncbi:phosphotransferase [Microbacterium sp.]|uniref:phosphotransferase n=1 Tax=Microbacterium sp. TaxID=51671 RepID=UPI0028123C32|nr:phosphotransferase [Microbacterium sp.]